MSSYRYNVISYSLLRTLRFVHVVVSLHNVTPDYTFSFIFENLLTFLFLFSFRLVKVAKRETEIRGRGGERGRNSFFFFSTCRQRGRSVRQLPFLVLFSNLVNIWRGQQERLFATFSSRWCLFSSWGERRGIFWGGKRRDSLTLTFIMSSTVFNTMRPMIKYSKGVDTTILQILYFTLFRSFGMYLSRGRACIVKSMQDFWNERRTVNRDLSLSLLSLQSFLEILVV